MFWHSPHIVKTGAICSTRAQPSPGRLCNASAHLVIIVIVGYFVLYLLHATGDAISQAYWMIEGGGEQAENPRASDRQRVSGAEVGESSRGSSTYISTSR